MDAAVLRQDDDRVVDKEVYEMDMIDAEDMYDDSDDDADVWDSLLEDADQLSNDHDKSVDTWDKQKRWIWVSGLVITVLILGVLMYRRLT